VTSAFTPKSARAKANAAPALPEEPVIVVSGDSARADSTHIPASIREHVTVERHHAEPVSAWMSSLRNLMLPKDPNAFRYSKGRLPLRGDFKETAREKGMSKIHNRMLDDDADCYLD
jgi:hypothetical protein